MVWRITPQQPVPVDPLFSSVSLLLHGDGTDGSTSIIDSSPLPKTMTTVGNAQISTAQSRFGGSSLYFDGTGDWITTPFNSGWSFGSSDFTIELWVRSNSSNQYASLVSADAPSNYGWALLMNPAAGDGKITFYELNIATSLLTTSSGGFNDNTWRHVALVRNDSLLSIYVNGTSLASRTTALAASTPGALYVGGSVVNANRALSGYIDDLRITKGVARYTSNFTPPTAPFPDI